MFSICRETHPATGIEHCVDCCFFENDETCLVTAGANVIKVFRLFPEGESKETNAAGQPIPPKMKLECLASYTLWGCVMSMASVKCPSMGRDLLLVSFREAKMSVLQYDPQTNDLITLSMHYFEEDDMKNGWTSHPHIPWIRVDPEGRCAVLLLYGRKLAVLPFRKDTATEDADPTDSKPLQEAKSKMQAPQIVLRSPTLASYVIVLKELDDKIDNILDIQFLHGYYEPTLLLLYEPIRTFAGRTAVRSDTCAMASVSLNMSARVHPVIWSVPGLPFDCTQAVPLHKPIGGCLVFAVNSLIYLNQSVPPYGVSLNSIATHTTNFPLRIQEGVSITLDAACAARLGEGRLVLSLKGGQLYVLTLISDSVRSVRSFHLERAAASVLTCCMCVLEEDFLFLGSRLGNSLLLRVTERENKMLFSVDKPLEATVDLTGPDKEKEELASKRRRVESLSELVPTDVIDLTDQDELTVYGSDIRTSTMLTGYVFEGCLCSAVDFCGLKYDDDFVCDSLLNIGPIGSIAMGEPQLFGPVGAGSMLELVASSGQGKNGALTVLQRSVHTHCVTAFHLPGCIDMWTIIGEPGDSRDASKDMEGSHAYLILTQEDGSMILQTGQEINEVDNSGFMTSAPTVFAGNLGNNKFMVQVTTNAIRLVKHGVQIQSIQLEWSCCYANVADPYLCVVSTCGRALVLALREFRNKDGPSARLAPTRQAVPHRPPLLKATVYRDLSGLFSSTIDTSHIKAEFTGKNKGKKKPMKAEGFEAGTVYELNDEDELLYGGDITPASMANIMMQEQCSGAGSGLGQSVPRRVSRWWRRPVPAASYWLLVVRHNGNLELYSLPEMKLCYLVRDATHGTSVLADSLEYVEVPADGVAEDSGPSRTSKSAEGLKEILMVGLGARGSRPLLLMRMEKELYIYQVYKYPRGKLKMRFSRAHVNFAFGYSGSETTEGEQNYEAWILRDSVRQMRYFGNIGGYNGVFICGKSPYFLFLSGRGELRLHPLALAEAPVLTFASFNNANCRQGCMYYSAKGELRISVLPSHVSYEARWALRKVPIRMTPRRLTYHHESRTYCLLSSQSVPTTSYYRFNGEDKEFHEENKGDRFPYPMMEQYSVSLFSPVSWEIIPNSKIELESWEHCTALETVALSYEGTMSGLRGYIALGTNYNYSEDITSRGRIIIYDIIDVVPEPGQPLTKNKFKEIYAKEQKGPVTALAQVLGFLVSAIGQKIYIWQLKDNDLVGVAFIDTQIYVHRMLSIKNMILVADVYKSVSLLRYQPTHRTLSLVSRDLRQAQIYDMQFMVDNTSLGFLVSESEGNFVLFMYQPQARESYGGQRLIRKADFHLGQQVHAMFRINARDLDKNVKPRHATVYTTLDGALGYILPLSEKTYRRLLMLQNVLNNYLRHIAGLNPRGFRTYKSSRKQFGSGPARGILDGDLVAQYLTLSNIDRNLVAKKIGTKVEEILADLNEIDQLTAFF